MEYLVLQKHSFLRMVNFDSAVYHHNLHISSSVTVRIARFLSFFGEWVISTEMVTYKEIVLIQPLQHKTLHIYGLKHV